MMNPADFFQIIYGTALDCKHVLTIWDRQTRDTVVFFDTSDPLQKYIDKCLSKQRDVYFGVCLRTDNLTGRGKAEHCITLPGFWLDIDIASPGHSAANLPQTVAEAFEILSQGPKPSLVVHTGGGLHAYWLFTTPLELTTPADRAQWNKNAKNFQVPYINYAKTRGWHLDQTGDLARILRVPGTTNFKYVVR